MRGISQLTTSVLLVLMTILVAGILASWLSTLTTEKTQTVSNQTQQKLDCTYADLYIKSASLNCTANNCSTGVSHNLTVTLQNTGTVSLTINKIYMQNTTGSTLTFNLPSTLQLNSSDIVTVSNTTTAECFGFNASTKVEKLIVSSTQCPNEAFDTLDGSDITFLDC